MESPNLLHRIINAYSKKNNVWEIKYGRLLEFIKNLVINDESGRYGIFSTNTADILTAMLMDLGEAGVIGLKYIGSEIDYIENYGQLNQVVRSAYEKLESNSEYPFPTQSSIGINIPEERLETIHLPENITVALKAGNQQNEKLYKILLSGDLSPIIAEGDIVRTRMLVLAVNKVRNFLTYKNNSNFMYQKMLPGCGKNTRALVETIKMVQSNPGRAAQSIKKPDEFIFSFWTLMCSFIRKDLAGKENKTGHDEGLLQSALLIHSYILHYKNIIISNKQKNEALKYVGEKLRKEPYHFTISDIYGFRDKSGPLLDKKYNRNDLHEFINSKLKLHENEVLPELIKIKTVNNKLYYIHKSVFLNLVHTKINDAHEYYRRVYLDSWAEELKNYKEPSAMTSDEAFHADLENRVKNEDPLLYAILGYELLFLAISDTKNIKLKAVAQGWIDPKLTSTRPLPIILNLHRRNLASEVRSSVPFWLSFGLFRKLAAIFGGRKKKKKSMSSAGRSTSESVPKSTTVSTASKTLSTGKQRTNSRAVEYKRALDGLKKQIGYSSNNSHIQLDELANQWNPLLDYEARSNLVKDVNNMVRDYMRKILRETAFAVPNQERIENIAELLAGNKAFSVIKKRSSFKKYIVLYIVKTLTETKP